MVCRNLPDSPNLPDLLRYSCLKNGDLESSGQVVGMSKWRESCLCTYRGIYVLPSIYLTCKVLRTAIEILDSDHGNDAVVIAALYDHRMQASC